MRLLAWLCVWIDPPAASSIVPPIEDAPHEWRELPPGWTDDLSIELRTGKTVEELVDYVITANREGREAPELAAGLSLEFGVSDWEFVLDRVQGGIVRALTGNPDNCPRREKDPIAWASFQRAMSGK